MHLMCISSCSSSKSFKRGRSCYLGRHCCLFTSGLEVLIDNNILQTTYVLAGKRYSVFYKLSKQFNYTIYISLSQWRLHILCYYYFLRIILFSWLMMNAVIMKLYDKFKIYPGNNNTEVRNLSSHPLYW